MDRKLRSATAIGNGYMTMREIGRQSAKASSVFHGREREQPREKASVMPAVPPPRARSSRRAAHPPTAGLLLGYSSRNGSLGWNDECPPAINTRPGQSGAASEKGAAASHKARKPRNKLWSNLHPSDCVGCAQLLKALPSSPLAIIVAEIHGVLGGC